MLAAGTAAFTFLGRGSSDLSACRSAAWAAIPDAAKLPAGWTIGQSDLNANGLTVSIVGPPSADGSTRPPVVYASVTCYGDAAAAALESNRKGADAAGATISDRTADGQAYDVDNPSTGSVTTLFRVGGLIGQVADAGTAAPADLAAISTAMAAAMGDGSAAGSGGIVPPPAGSGDPLGSEPAPTDEASPTPFAPELERLMPSTVGTTKLTIQSASATDLFGDDPASRALSARIRALGGTMDQLEIAQAYDEASALDVSIIGFRLPGADAAKLKTAIVETWLSAGADGIPTTTVTLGGKSLTKVDYGDQGTTQYVYAGTDYVIVIDTADANVAAEVAKELK